MTSFDELKTTIRRNQLLGMWAAEKLGLVGSDADKYAKSLATDTIDPERAVRIGDFHVDGDGARAGARTEVRASIRIAAAVVHWLGIVRAQGHDHPASPTFRREHREFQPWLECHVAPNSASARLFAALRLLLRLVARVRHDRSRVLQVDAMDLPAAVRRVV